MAIIWAGMMLCFTIALGEIIGREIYRRIVDKNERKEVE